MPNAKVKLTKSAVEKLCLPPELGPYEREVLSDEHSGSSIVYLEWNGYFFIWESGTLALAAMRTAGRKVA